MTRAADEQPFSYHRAVGPMMWVLVALMAIEMLVLHALLAFWLPMTAMVLTVATLAFIAWMVHAIRSLRRRPVLVDDERVLMRVGVIREVAVPIEDIAAVGGELSRAELGRDVLNLALIAHPNLHLRLCRPITRGRRVITAVAHRVDDPGAFTAAVEQRLRAAAPPARAAA